MIPVVGGVQRAAAGALDVIENDILMVQMRFEHNIRYKTKSVARGGQTKRGAQLIESVIDVWLEIARGKCAQA